MSADLDIENDAKVQRFIAELIAERGFVGPFLLIIAGGDSCLIRRWENGEITILLDHRSDYINAQPESVIFLVDGRGQTASITISRNLQQ